MKRIVKILGIATLLAALLAVSIGTTVFAANGPNGPGENCEPIGDGPFGPNAPDDEVIPNGPNGPNGDCVCEPIGDGPFGPVYKTGNCYGEPIKSQYGKD